LHNLEATDEPSTFGLMQKELCVHFTFKDLPLLRNLKMARKSAGGMQEQSQQESVLEGRRSTSQVGSSSHLDPILSLIVYQTSMATEDTTIFGYTQKGPSKYGSTRVRSQAVKHLQMWVGGHKA